MIPKKIKTEHGVVSPVLPKRKKVKSYGELGNYHKQNKEASQEANDSNQNQGEEITEETTQEQAQQQEKQDKNEYELADLGKEPLGYGEPQGAPFDVSQLIESLLSGNTPPGTSQNDQQGGQSSKDNQSGDSQQNPQKQEEKVQWTKVLDLHRRVHTLAAVFGAYTQGNISEVSHSALYTFKVNMPPKEKAVISVRMFSVQENDSVSLFGLPLFLEQKQAEAFAELAYEVIVAYAFELNIAHQNLLKEIKEHYKVIHIIE